MNYGLGGGTGVATIMGEVCGKARGDLFGRRLGAASLMRFDQRSISIPIAQVLCYQLKLPLP